MNVIGTRDLWECWCVFRSGGVAFNLRIQSGDSGGKWVNADDVFAALP